MLSSQAQWVSEAIAGDTVAFGRLVRAHSPAVCAITLAITRDLHSSEEVAQDVFVLAWSRLHQLKNPASFGPWLRQLCRNRSREFLRTRSRRERKTVLDNQAVEGALSPSDPSKQLIDAEEERLLADAIQALPDDTREVLILYYREGQSVRQVARLLELSEAAVRKRLSRARKRLRADVAERMGAVVRKTVPGAALVALVLDQISPRAVPAAGAATTAFGVASVGMMLGATLLGLALMWFLGASSESSPVDPSGPELSSGSGPSQGRSQQAADGASEDRRVPVAAAARMAQATRLGEFHVQGAGQLHHPVFSPSGDYLAYEVSRPTGRVDLFIARVEGQEMTEGLRVPLPGVSPFSADAVRAMNGAWHASDLLVFEGRGSGDVRRLFYYPPGAGMAAEFLPTTALQGSLTFPSISGDGSQVAMVAGHTGNGDIYTRETATGKVVRQTDTETSESFPSFSPDGTEILFSRAESGTKSLVVKRLSEGVETPLLTGPGHPTRPTYAGSEYVVYFDGSRGEGVWDLMSIALDGGEPTRIGTDVRLPLRGRPAVSEDGDWVAFTSRDPDKARSVQLVMRDGSKARTIWTGHTACGDPALTERDGRVILAYTAQSDREAESRFLEVLDITDPLR